MSIVIGTVEKNKNEVYVISLGEYKGKNFIDVRVNFYDKNDKEKLIPTKKGIAISKRNFQPVVGLLIEAFKKLDAFEAKNASKNDENDVPDPS